MTHQAVDILSSWRPNGVSSPPADLVAPEHTLSPTHLAIWLATCDEMARLEMEAA